MEVALIVSSVLLWIVLLFNLLLTLALVRRTNANTKQNISTSGLKTGQQAPGFTAQTLEGETVALATYAGRKVAFLFVSTHCKPCRDLLPTIENLRPGATNAGVELVLVMSDEMEQTRSFVAEQHIQTPVLVAPRDSNTFHTDYQVKGTPSFCLVDEQGKVQAAGYPSMEWGSWKDLAASWTGNKDLVLSH